MNPNCDEAGMDWVSYTACRLLSDTARPHSKCIFASVKRDLHMLEQSFKKLKIMTKSILSITIQKLLSMKSIQSL